MKKTIFLLFSIILATKSYAQIGAPPNAEPGKCYAKCIASIDSVTKQTTWTNWEEVVCQSDITPKLIKQIRQKLKNEGYAIDVFSEIWDSKAKEVLTQYQKTNKLPMGNINVKTMEALRIDF